MAYKPLSKAGSTPSIVRMIRLPAARLWIATDRRDLTAKQAADAYKLRWEIESFFAWWKRHLKVYHLMARSRYGLMVQICAGLITYLLLSIYCQKVHKERVSIKRVRENCASKSKTSFAKAAGTQMIIFSKNKTTPGYTQKPNRTTVLKNMILTKNTIKFN